MRRPTILLVDDDEKIRTGLAALLETEGYGVICASDGAEALELLSTGPAPSLILLDLMMPVVDGWQFLARRAADSGTSRVPIVLLSGLGFIPDAPGVADFISKPVRPEKLLACVKRFCRTTPGGE